MPGYLKTFIASSSEHLRVAQAIQTNLSKVNIATTVWMQGVFEPGIPFLEAITREVRKADFAIIILSADDELKLSPKRHPESKDGATSLVPRDNIIFEMGICVGILGIERTFFVADKNVKLPSDIDGITGLSYQLQQDIASMAPADLKSALGVPCNEIQEKMRELDYRHKLDEDNIVCKTVVDIYYFEDLFTRADAEQLASRLLRKFDFNIWAHKRGLEPDAIFIGTCVPAEYARMVISAVPYTIEYIFRLDYPEVDGGHSKGFKIGVGYSSKYAIDSIDEKSMPIRITQAQLEQLVNPKLSNTEFHLYLYQLTHGAN